MDLSEIESLLRQEIGLNADSIGAKALAAAVRARMTATGTGELTAYQLKLNDGRLELNELIEEIVVPETWFFRGLEQLTHLAQHTANCRRPFDANRVFRVLSVPCSTGEEPYSIAAVLLDAGITADRIQIDAVEISRRALDQAQRAMYGAASFREQGPESVQLRERYFIASGSQWQPLEIVRRVVRFRPGNLVEAGFLAGETPYDAVFCRNLLIYFDAESRAQVLDALSRLVAPNGLVFMGHAEPLAMWDRRFQRAGPPRAFAFRLAAVQANRPHQPRESPSGSGPGPVLPATHLPQTASQLAARAMNRVGPAAADLLDRVERLASRGQFSDAETACDEFLEGNAPTARAFHLLGVIRQALGDFVEAEQAFQRALYLEPKHTESLLHLTLLAEAREDQVAAANYRRRMRQSGPTSP